MPSFQDMILFVLTQIRTLILPGSLETNCTRVDGDANDLTAFLNDQPSSKYFLSHLSATQKSLLIIGSAACALLILIGFLQARFVCRYVSERKLRKLLLVISFLFPGSAALCLVGMFVPRAATINASLGLFVFLFAIAALVRLCRTLVGGWDNLSATLEAKGHRMSLMNPPFCCVLPCLPRIAAQPRRLRYLELAVSQAPMVRMLVIVTQIVAIAEYREEASVILQLCDVASLASLLLLVFGFHTISRAAGESLTKFSYSTLFRLVDIGLLFFSAQEPLIFENIFVRFGAIGCSATLSPHDQARFICNFVVIIELFFLTLLGCVLLRPRRSALFDEHPHQYLPCSSSECFDSESSQQILIAP